VKTVASPGPEAGPQAAVVSVPGPPQGSPTIAVVPLADIATEVPKLKASAGEVSAVPGDHDVPL